MMSGMMTGMYWGLLLTAFLVIGFAYIIWVLASKEAGGIRITGQIIAIVIAVLAVLILGGAFSGFMGNYGRGMRGVDWRYAPNMMMPGSMMNLPEKESREYIREKMKYPQMRKMMQEPMKQEQKK